MDRFTLAGAFFCLAIIPFLAAEYMRDKYDTPATLWGIACYVMAGCMFLAGAIQAYLYVTE